MPSRICKPRQIKNIGRGFTRIFTNYFGNIAKVYQKGFQSDISASFLNQFVLLSLIIYELDKKVEKYHKMKSDVVFKCLTLYVCIFITEIDECAGENDCHYNATCTNTVGSYNCTCNDGFEGNGTSCEGKQKFELKPCFVFRL